MTADADAGPAPADSEFRQRYLAENRRLGEQGLRVIAVARTDLDPAAFDPGADLLPQVTGLELLALVGIVDPPRPTARASITTATKAGIRVRMITGDYAVTAAAVAGQLGINGTVLTGAEFGAMSDEEALAKVDGIGVIARVSPAHKVRLVDVLRKKGQIVAMTGDGVNDAPAVKKADIGIAMGTGTEVTQEAAVMILTEDNFSTIVRAVELGRGLYDNLARYIRFQIGGLFGYIATFLGASIFNIAQGIPLLPLQTLWVSFTMLSIQSGRARLQPARRRADGTPAPAAQPADPHPRTHRLARIRRPADGSRHPRRDQLGGAGARARRRPDHGHGHVRAVPFVLLDRVQRGTGSAFSLDTFSDKTFLITTSGSFVLLILSTVLGIFHRDQDRQARRPATPCPRGARTCTSGRRSRPPSKPLFRAAAALPLANARDGGLASVGLIHRITRRRRCHGREKADGRLRGSIRDCRSGAGGLGRY
jgi:Ca2+-transporting ATPase